MHCLYYELTVLPKIYHCLISVYLAMQITCIFHMATRDRNNKKRNQQIFRLIFCVYIATSGFGQVSEKVKGKVFSYLY